MNKETKVKFLGWEEHLEVVPLINLLKKAGLGLAKSKYAADDILEKKEVIIECSDNLLAIKLVEEATKLGAICVLNG